MRQSNPGRRPRGRPNRKHHVSPRSQTFDSSGPDVRVRGNAHQVYEKYLALARDATSSGDRVAAEGYYQFAEHYFRVLNDSTDPQPLHSRPNEHNRPNERRERPGQQGGDSVQPDQQPQPEVQPVAEAPAGRQASAESGQPADAEAATPRRRSQGGNGAAEPSAVAASSGEDVQPRQKRSRPRRRPTSEARAPKPNGSAEPAAEPEGETPAASDDVEVPAS